jgi:hypothetical protein
VKYSPETANNRKRDECDGLLFGILMINDFHHCSMEISRGREQRKYHGRHAIGELLW